MKPKKNIEKGRVIGGDWAHDDEKEVFYDGLNWYTKEDDLDFKDGDILVVENIPVYKAVKLMEKGVEIFTCHTMSSKEHRTLLGYPRLHHYNNEGHAVDALVVYDLYQKKPQLFHKYKINYMKMLYANFTEIQKTRISSGQRAWSKEAKEMTNATTEFLEQAEKETERLMDKYGKGDITYDYLQNIPYIGPRTGCGLLALADATRFEHESQLRRYVGLSVINGEIQRFRKGESNGYKAQAKALLLKRIGDNFIKSSGRENISAYFMDYMMEKEKQQKRPPQLISIDDEKNIVGDLLAEKIDGLVLEVGKRIYKKHYDTLKKICKKQNKSAVLIRLSDGRINHRAIRKMMQMLLEDYWVISRQLQGFSTIPPYVTTILGHNGYRKPHYIPAILEPFNPLRDTGWIFTEGKRPWKDASSYIRDKCGQ